MAAPDEILESIGCLGLTFPQFVQREIAKVTDQFVANIKSFSNPFAQAGDLSVQGLLAEVAKLGQGDIMGNVGAVAGLVDQLAQVEVNDLVPGLSVSPSGNRITDVTNMAGAVAGRAMLTMSLVPETPFIVAQRLCETLTQLTATKLKNLECLRTHIVQISNAMTILMHLRTPTMAALDADLETVLAQLEEASAEFASSRRLVNGSMSFDINAFDRGRNALDAAMAALMPKITDAHQAFLAMTTVADAATLPSAFSTALNSRLALVVVPHLMRLIRAEVSAVQAQSDAIRHYLEQLRNVVLNYRSSPTGKQMAAMRLSLVSAILAKLESLEASINAAIAFDSRHATAHQLLDWGVQMRAIQATAGKVRAQELVEGAVDEVTDAILKATYGTLISTLDGVNSTHVVKAVDDVSDLTAKCLGICSHADLLLKRLGMPIAATDADLRTFQVLVANTAMSMTDRITESETTCVAIAAACEPMIALSILARPSFDKLVSSLEGLGLDRGRDLLASGMFSSFLSANLDDLSYLGAAIKCLTGTLVGIDDAGLRRQVAAIRADLVSRKINLQLGAADNLEFASLRRAAGIKDEIAALQASAATIQNIVSYLKDLATGMGLDLGSIDPLNHDELLPSIDYLAVNGGGRLATAVAELSRPSAGLPTC